MAFSSHLVYSLWKVYLIKYIFGFFLTLGVFPVKCLFDQIFVLAPETSLCAGNWTGARHWSRIFVCHSIFTLFSIQNARLWKHFFNSNIGGIEALGAERYIYGWQHLGQLYFDFKIEMWRIQFDKSGKCQNLSQSRVLKVGSL